MDYILGDDKVKNLKRLINAGGLFTLLCVPIFLPLQQKVHQYIDAGTASVILQGVLGGIVAGLAMVRIFLWKTVKRIFSRFRSKDKESEVIEDENSNS